MKMNRIVLDTETANTIEEPIAYDIGWAVIDENGAVVKTESYAVAEIFLDKELMALAYFAEKIPQYWEEIKNGNRKLARLSTIYRAFRTDCVTFNVTECFAHNANFDDRALKYTQRFISGSRYRYFIPYGITLNCTLEMSRRTIANDEDYIRFCKDNDYITKNNRPRLTAEIIYRFLSGNDNFTEAHKGIDDVLIEKDILMECLKRGA